MGLIAELTGLQARCGYLGESDLRELAGRLRLPLYRIQEVVSFYPHFRRTPPPRAEVALCRDLCCFLAGAGGWSARAPGGAGPLGGRGGAVFGSPAIRRGTG